MKVVILLSTYNGDLYLREQIESILHQNYRNIEILIRDDGSTDSTIKLLDSYCCKYTNMSYYKGDNLKSARSFMDLVNNAPLADYYAFCDQDDIWKQDKIETALNMLKSSHSDLYYSSYTTVDKRGVIIQENVNHHSHKDTLGASLVDLSVTGCTMVFTRKLWEDIIHSNPQNIMMHDSWVYKVALCMRRPIIYDPVAHIYYRQHGNNVIGAQMNWKKVWVSRYNRWFKTVTNRRYNEVYELYKEYAMRMPAESIAVIEPIIGYKEKNFFQRFKIATNKVYRTRNIKLDFPFIISILAKRY